MTDFDGSGSGGLQLEKPSPRTVRVFLNATQISRATKEWDAAGGVTSANPCPPDFLCPLSLDIMANPVVIASGHTYECAYIQRWLEDHRTCPKTNQRLPDLEMQPNLEVREAIMQWCVIYGVCLPTQVEVDENILMRPSFQGGLLESDSGRLLLSSRMNSLRQKMSGRASLGSPNSMSRQPSTETMRGQLLARFDSKVSMGSFRQKMANPGSGRTLSPMGSLSYSQGPQSSERASSSGLRPGSFMVPRSQSESAPFSAYVHPLISGGSSRSYTGPQSDPTLADIKACVEQASGAASPAKEEAVKQLRALTRVSRSARMSMAQCGAIPVLVRCCAVAEAEEVAEEVVENAVAALLNLAGEMDLKQPVALAGAVPVLVELLKRGEGSKSQENAAGALSNLSIHAPNRILIQSAGAIPLLHSLGVRCSSERTQKDAIIALFNLSINTSCRTAIIQLGTMEELIEELEVGGGEVEEEAALLLSNLVKCPQGCERFLNMGGVCMVASILDGSNRRAKGHAAAILLSTACGHHEGLAAVRNEVVVASLAMVAANGTLRGQEKATALLKMMRGEV